MRKFLPFLFFITALGFTACGGDEEKETDDFNSSIFSGEWCMLDVQSNTATMMTINSDYTFAGRVYDNISVYPFVFETISGHWMYYPANKVLNMDVLHSATHIQKTTAYNVQKIDDYTLQVRNQEFGTTEVYHHIAGVRSATLGEVFDLSKAINLPDGTTPTAYSTSHKGIATVDKQGRVTITGTGTVFISIEASEGSMIYIVNIPSRIEIFSAEVCSSIDAIISAHGKPDMEGAIGKNKAIFYSQPSFDKGLSSLQYHYDENTREVTRVLAKYATSEVFESDKAVVKTYFKLVGDNLYGLFESFSRNEVILSPFTEDGDFMSFINLPYYSKNGHY